MAEVLEQNFRANLAGRHQRLSVFQGADGVIDLVEFDEGGRKVTVHQTTAKRRQRLIQEHQKLRQRVDRVGSAKGFVEQCQPSIGLLPHT